MAFVCSATWTAKPGEEATVRAALATRLASPDVATFVVHRDLGQE